MSSFSNTLILAFWFSFCKVVRADGILPLALGGGLGALLGLIVLILDVIAIVDSLKSDRSVLGKLLWILLILFFPVGGLIIWCLCGRTTSDVV